MNTQQKNKEKGFTIIEVVLVLAIAGLIFLMVFIALPALQRGQRDTQRRDDVGRFISQLQQYATNNRGSIPQTQNQIDDFLVSYLRSDQGEFKDPATGSTYTVRVDNGGSLSLQDGQIQYAPGRTCNGEEIGGSASARQAAVRVKLEGAGYFCQNAQ